MGIGDELVATGQARLLQESDPRPVCIVDRHGQPRWHPAWDHNPRLSRSRVGAQTLTNGPNARPWIEGYTPERWLFREWDCPPGEIYLTRDEEAFGDRHGGWIVVEPNIKPTASPNKDWGWERWLQLVQKLHGLPLAQIGPVGTRWLPGVSQVPTPTFRHAAAVLARSRAYVGHEGALHHAAAAVDLPAVVLMGGFVSPRQTGYRTHRNLFTGGEPCGMRKPCDHCRRAMAAITLEMVLRELEEVLAEQERALV